MTVKAVSVFSFMSLISKQIKRQAHYTVTSSSLASSRGWANENGGRLLSTNTALMKLRASDLSLLLPAHGPSGDVHACSPVAWPKCGSTPHLLCKRVIGSLMSLCLEIVIFSGEHQEIRC